MPILNILRYPDPRLHKVAKPVTSFDARLKQLIADMAETMYDAPGVGLAASQVDVHEQLVVIDISEANDQLQVFINPEIIWASEEKKSTTKVACLYRAFMTALNDLPKSKSKHWMPMAKNSKFMPKIYSLFAYNTSLII
jgi:peptide deformylase